MLEQTRRDVAYAVRLLLKTPTFTLIATLTLAMGVSLLTAVFTQVNAVFLTRLSVERPEELRLLSWSSPRRAFAGPRLTQRIWDQWIAEGHHIESFSYAAYRNLADNESGFASVACWRRGLSVRSAQYGRVSVQFVSGTYFNTVGASALVGRVLTVNDDRPGTSIVPAVVSHSFWLRALGGDPKVLETPIDLDRVQFVIVGVMPSTFYGVALASAPDLMVPFASQPRAADDWHGCNLIARVSPGVSDEQARSRSEALVRQAIVASVPRDPYEPPRVWLSSAEYGDDDFRRATSRSLGFLLAATALVFFVACANVAGLLLARGSARHKEMATRLALGASRGRIVRLLLTEGLVLSIAGLGVGIAATFLLVPVLPQVLAQFGGETGAQTVALTPNLRVLGFAVALGLLNGLLFGLAPALVVTRLTPLEITRPSQGFIRATFGSGKVAVTMQVALSMTLLISAGLCVRTMINLRAVPLGFDPSGLIFVTLNTDGQPPDFLDQMLSRLSTLPSVVSASASQYPLFGEADRSLPLCVPGFLTNEPAHRFVDGDQVSPGHFATWRVPIRSGREFQSDDVGRRVVVVNDAFAARFYPGQNAVGQTLGYGPNCTGTEQTIVGVTASATDNPRTAGTPAIYVPYRRHVGFVTFAVRTDGDSSAVVAAIRAVLIDRGSSLRGDITTGVDYRDQATARERMLTSLLTAFSTIGLLLSVMGIYGALAYIATRRTHEIGIRIALGAASANVVRLVARESLIPVWIGIVVGVAAASGATRWIDSILFGVAPTDVPTIVVATAVFGVTAAMAAVIPSIRASRIDPVRALRSE
jgi:putative ABC transport system permease protein